MGLLNTPPPFMANVLRKLLHWFRNCVTLSVTITILEIKPCVLGSRIRDMEADLIYW